MAGWGMHLRASRERVARYWRHTRAHLAVVAPCWFALSVSILIAFVCAAVPQVVDILSAIGAEHRFWSWNNLSLLLATLFYSVSVWYVCRTVLYVHYDHPPLQTDIAVALRKWTPRIAGALPLAGIALGFLFGRQLKPFVTYLGLFLLFIGFVIWRRRLLRKRPHATPEETKQLEAREFSGANDTLPALSRWLLIGVGALMLLLFVLVLASRVHVPQLVGPLGVVLLALGSYVIAITLVLIYPTRKFGLPSLLTIVLLAAIVFGFWNDNHGIARPADEYVPPADRPGSIAEHFNCWLQARGVLPSAADTSDACRSDALVQPDLPYPLYVVSAEGGGIRAAYWTNAILHAIQSAEPKFACHVYAMSGVSGGSLGIATFAAALADELETERDGRGAVTDGCPFMTRTLTARPIGVRVLGEDFLSPALAGLLFPDTVQRLVPVALPPWIADRAAFLEESWETAWEEHTGNDRFGEDFLRLWHEEKFAYVPSLLLNATSVESGQRMIVTNLPPGSGYEDFERQLSHSKHMGQFTGHSLKLSTAVHLSARFTYLSPAATVTSTDGERKYRVVDGGYFENSGTTTAMDLVRLLNRACTSEPFSRMQPGCVVRAIVISNDTANPNRFSADELECGQRNLSRGTRVRATQDPAAERGASNFMPELLAPIRALLASRSARGYVAEQQLSDEADVIRFQLKARSDQKIPLGWVISDTVQQALSAQAISAPNIGCISDQIRSAAQRPNDRE